MTGRHALLLAGLLLSAGLLWLDGGSSTPEVVQPLARRTEGAVAAASAAVPSRPRAEAAARPGDTAALPGDGAIPALLPRQAVVAVAEGGVDPFDVRSWAPPPPPPAPVAAASAPPPPQAPPLPFRYVGRQQAAGVEQVFLVEGEQLHVVGLHGVIGGRYRLEQMGSKVLLLTYLPMNLSQQLSTGSSE